MYIYRERDIYVYTCMYIYIYIMHACLYNTIIYDDTNNDDYYLSNSLYNIYYTPTRWGSHLYSTTCLYNARFLQQWRMMQQIKFAVLDKGEPLTAPLPSCIDLEVCVDDTSMGYGL